MSEISIIDELKDRLTCYGGGRWTRGLLTRAVDEIERLRAIVDRLPVTADGVSVTPGMVLWVWTDNGELIWFAATDFYGGPDDWWTQPGQDPYCIQDDCYSTQAAVQAAREE